MIKLSWHTAITSSSHEYQCEANQCLFCPLQTHWKDNVSIGVFSDVALKDSRRSDSWAVLDHMSPFSVLEVPAYYLKGTDFLDSLCLNTLFETASREALIPAKRRQNILDKEPTKLFPQATMCLSSKASLKSHFRATKVNKLYGNMYTHSLRKHIVEVKSSPSF